MTKNTKRWIIKKKPNAEERVLITFINHRNKKPCVCIAEYFPKGYEIDWNPTIDYEECDFLKRTIDSWFFTKEMWMESYFHCDEVRGVWIEDDEVIAWKPLPNPCMEGVITVADFAELNSIEEKPND